MPPRLSSPCSGKALRQPGHLRRRRRKRLTAHPVMRPSNSFLTLDREETDDKATIRVDLKPYSCSLWFTRIPFFESSLQPWLFGAWSYLLQFIFYLVLSCKKRMFRILKFFFVFTRVGLKEYKNDRLLPRILYPRILCLRRIPCTVLHCGRLFPKTLPSGIPFLGILKPSGYHPSSTVLWDTAS